MLYLLYSSFGINVFKYLTVRALFGFFVAFLLTLFMMPSFIRWAKSKSMKQPIHMHVPDGHKQKRNTPTMGGVVFIVSTVLATLISAQLDNMFIILALFLTVAYMAIGLKDDIGKVVSANNEMGLSAKGKFALQIGVALMVSVLLFFAAKLNGQFYIPFLKTPLFDMGFAAVLFWCIVIVAASNAVNLTDGLDGLAAVPSIFSFVSLGVLVYITGNAVLSGYLFMPKLPGSGELTVICFAMVGALLGFLWYNSNPAEVFMGDSGSLSIGALIGFMAVCSKSEILLLAIGFIFVLETLSVIIQVASYRSRGKRVFLMAPIHHHFELKKWAENKIIVRFWIISLLSNIIALLSIKIR